MFTLAAVLLSLSNVSIHTDPPVTAFRPVAFAAAPSGPLILLTLEDGSVRVYDTARRQTVRTLAKHPQGAYAAAWSPDGTKVATGDETARIWIEDPRTGKKIREYRTHIKGIEKLSFTSDSAKVVSTGKDDEIKIYDLTDSRPKEIKHILGKGANVYGCTADPRNPGVIATAMLVLGGGRTYDWDTGKVQGFLGGHDNQGALDLTYNPQGTIIATAGKDGTVVLLNTATSTKIGVLKGHTDWVTSVTFSPNGKLAAGGSADGTVKVWDVNTLQKIGDLPKQNYVVSPVVFSGDGRTLATVTDQGYLQLSRIDPAQSGPAPKLKKVKKHRRRRHH